MESVPSSNITNFTRIAKSQTLADTSTKRTIDAIIPGPGPTRKRKASSLEYEKTRARLNRLTVSSPPSSDDEHGQDVAPRKRPRQAEPVPSVSASQKTGLSISASAGQSNHSLAAAPAEPLPQHLKDLVALNKAFLEVLTMYIAQNDWGSPIDIGDISPDVSRTWGKRRVTVEDIRRCIAIQYHDQERAACPFIICNYGRGRVCLEVPASINELRINTGRLCHQFEANIRALYAEKAADQLTNEDLPLVDVKDLGDTLSNPLMVRGNKALASIKSDVAAREQKHREKPEAPKNPDGTNMSLLDRIRQKRIDQTNKIAHLSNAEKQRIAALNRVVDVASTISALSFRTGAWMYRQPFTMMLMTQKIQDSLSSISKEQSMACVRIIATEVAPEWLKIMHVGGRENVVVERHQEPVGRVISERVQKLLGRT